MPENDNQTIVVTRSNQSVSSEAGDDRRVSHRYPNEQNLSITGDITYNVELIDLSASGARVCIRQGLVPDRRAEVELQFMNGHRCKAFVVWTEGLNCGLEFHEKQDCIALMHHDDLGSDYYKAILRFQLFA